MRRARSIALLLVVAGMLPGCGSSTGAVSIPDGPKGALTKQEYRLLRGVARKVKQTENRAHSPKAGVKGLSSACEAGREAPTELLQAGHAGCLSILAFLNAVVEFGHAAPACKAEGGAATLDCLRPRIQTLTETARAVIRSGVAANRAASARGIHGRCRDFIGMSEKELRDYSRAASASAALDRAIRARKPRQIKLAASRFKAAFNRHEPQKDPLKELRACRRG